MSILNIKNLSFTYAIKNKKAIDNLNFTVKPREFTVIMGESGAGKSSLLLAIQRLIPYFSPGTLKGEIYFQDVEITSKTPRQLAGEIGLVFQDFETQLFSTNVELEVAFLPQNLGLKREEIKERVNTCLALVGLKDFHKRNPVHLSGGEKQRLAIAAILSGYPKLLLLDEPTTDLDPVGKEEIFKLAHLLKNKNQTTLLVEHETENINFADRLILMKNGKFLREGRPEKVMSNIDEVLDCGVRPPFASFLFKELNLGEVPLLQDDIYSILKENYEIDHNEYQKLIVEEERCKATSDLPLIEIKDLSFSYPGGKEVLKKINLNIKKGELVAIIGQNGSGKTTLAKHLNRLLLPEKGEVLIKGVPTTSSKIIDLAKTVGYVFQNPDHQIFANSVYEEVCFGPRNLGVPKDAIQERVKESLSAVHLSGYEEEDPFSLTRGERQRLAVASVLAQRPEILIFDEPTTGLDYPQTQSMMNLIVELNKKGYTIIIITHSMWVVTEYAKRCVVMKEGEIILDGKTRSVFQEKERLAEAQIFLPPAVSLSDKFGITLLSLSEWKKVLRKKDGNISLFRP